MSEETKLHLVFGSELKEVGANQFANPEAVDVIGIYPNYEDAEDAWRAAAQRTVDNALMRYYIADLSRLREFGSKNRGFK